MSTVAATWLLVATHVLIGAGCWLAGYAQCQRAHRAEMRAWRAAQRHDPPDNLNPAARGHAKVVVPMWIRSRDVSDRSE